MILHVLPLDHCIFSLHSIACSPSRPLYFPLVLHVFFSSTSLHFLFYGIAFSSSNSLYFSSLLGIACSPSLTQHQCISSWCLLPSVYYVFFHLLHCISFFVLLHVHALLSPAYFIFFLHGIACPHSSRSLYFLSQYCIFSFTVMHAHLHPGNCIFIFHSIAYSPSFTKMQVLLHPGNCIFSFLHQNASSPSITVMHILLHPSNCIFSFKVLLVFHP